MKPLLWSPLLAIVCGATLLLWRSGQRPSGADLRRPAGAASAPTASPAPRPSSGRDLRQATVAALAAGPQAIAGPLALWAAKDPAAAEAWVLELAGPARDSALATLVTEISRPDPAHGLQLADRIVEPTMRVEAQGFALAELAASDPEAVFARLAGNPAESTEQAQLQPALERKVLPALAEADPVRMAQWIADGRTTPEAAETAVVATVQRWCQRDPQATARWVADFQDPRLLRSAMEPLVALWTRQQDDAPAAWIKSLPAGDLRDEACAAYAAALATTGSGEARQWAQEIQQTELAAETLRRIGGGEEK